MKYEIITPLLTSINDDGSVDIDGTLNLVEYVIDGGVDGILPLGSAGEFTAFTFEQKRDISHIWQKTSTGISTFTTIQQELDTIFRLMLC